MITVLVKFRREPTLGPNGDGEKATMDVIFLDGKGGEEWVGTFMPLSMDLAKEILSVYGRWAAEQEV